MRYTPRNAKYITSPEIWNCIINVMAIIVRDITCSKVCEAKYFSVTADETKDISGSEQMAISIQYVHITSNAFSIQEHFLTYAHVNKLDAKSLAITIIIISQSQGLELDSIVSQGYDGASVMSGHLSGVQERIRQIAPRAIHIHCHAHYIKY